MSGPRWKYPNAQKFALDNPISSVYKQLQSLQPMKCFLAQSAAILQAYSHQCSILNDAGFGRPILIAHEPSLSHTKCCDCDPDEASLGSSDEIVVFELSLEEAFFLSYELKCLEIYSGGEQGNAVVDQKNVWQLMQERKHGFIYSYKAYSHLRKKNWVVRTGLQYGAHFIAYRHHPRQVHAEFAMMVVAEEQKQTQFNSWTSMHGSLRLCGSVAKGLLLLHVLHSGQSGDDHHPICLDSYVVKEMLVKRWLPEKHRMDCCKAENV